MDFFAEKSDLVKELTFVRNAVEKRSTILIPQFRATAKLASFLELATAGLS